MFGPARTRFFTIHTGGIPTVVIRICTSCKTQQTTVWRLDENGERLCNRLALNYLGLPLAVHLLHAQVWIAPEKVEEVKGKVRQPTST
jgi:hypothetical protein